MHSTSAQPQMRTRTKGANTGYKSSYKAGLWKTRKRHHKAFHLQRPKRRMKPEWCQVAVAACKRPQTGSLLCSDLVRSNARSWTCCSCGCCCCCCRSAARNGGLRKIKIQQKTRAWIRVAQFVESRKDKMHSIRVRATVSSRFFCL